MTRARKTADLGPWAQLALDVIRGDWLVEHGPPQSLFLGASSPITPGVPLEDLAMLTEGFRHYREH